MDFIYVVQLSCEVRIKAAWVSEESEFWEIGRACKQRKLNFLWCVGINRVTGLNLSFQINFLNLSGEDAHVLLEITRLSLSYIPTVHDLSITF